MSLTYISQFCFLLFSLQSHWAAKQDDHVLLPEFAIHLISTSLPLLRLCPVSGIHLVSDPCLSAQNMSRDRYRKKWDFGISLVVQWLGFHAFTTGAHLQSLAGELRVHKMCTAAKKKKERNKLTFYFPSHPCLLKTVSLLQNKIQDTETTHKKLQT